MRWMLSFCDTEKPVGEQFLGGCIVDADDELAAMRVAWERGCNPGGEVAFMDVDDGIASRLTFDLDPYMNRLLTKAEIENLDAWVSAVLEEQVS